MGHTCIITHTYTQLLVQLCNIIYRHKGLFIIDIRTIWHHSVLSTRPNDSTSLVTSVKASIWLRPRTAKVHFKNYNSREVTTLNKTQTIHSQTYWYLFVNPSHSIVWIGKLFKISLFLSILKCIQSRGWVEGCKCFTNINCGHSDGITCQIRL